MKKSQRLPAKIGGATMIQCPQCGKTHRVKYHGKSGDNDTYDHICSSCGCVLITESGGDGYSVDLHDGQ